MQANTTEIKARIREFIRSNFLLGEARNPEDGASLLDSGIVDSTGVLEVVDFLQSAWGIKVSDEEMRPENLDSIESLAAFVARKLPA